MTPLQKLQLRASEVRTKLNELGAVETLSDEQAAEVATLSKEYRDIETRSQALIIGADDPDGGETVEDKATKPDDKLLELRSKVSFADYAHAVVRDAPLDGAAAEFNAEIGLTGARDFPLEMLAPLEARTTTDADTAVAQRRWIDRLFADAMATRLGVTMESVEPGAAVYPVTTAGAASKQRDRAENAADDAWTMSTTKLEPIGRRARLVFSMEDDLRVPGLEQALRRDLEMEMVEGVDRAIFIGDDSATTAANDITGFTTAANVVEQEIAQADKAKGSKVLEAFANLIDGKHASMASDLNVVWTVGAYRLWMAALANTGTSVDTTVLEFLRRAGIEGAARGDLETATTAGKFGAIVGRSRGIAGAAVAAVWANGRLIRDEITKAASGEVALTLQYAWNFALPRATNFARIKFVA